MKLFKLDSSVLSFKNNASQFLNGLTSNASDTPQNAFLNIHGRIITTFYQKTINDDETWIIVPNERVDALLEHLDRYIKLSGIKVETLPHGVYFNIGESPKELPGNAARITLPSGEVIAIDAPLESSVSQEEFTLFRLNHRIPLQGVDYTDEFVLNVGAEELVSFTKGCFLGQEPVSKVYNRSMPSWQLVVEYEDKCGDDVRDKMTSKVIDPAVKRTRGFVFKRNAQANQGEEK